MKADSAGTPVGFSLLDFLGIPGGVVSQGEAYKRGLQRVQEPVRVHRAVGAVHRPEHERGRPYAMRILPGQTEQRVAQPGHKGHRSLLARLRRFQPVQVDQACRTRSRSSATSRTWTARTSPCLRPVDRASTLPSHARSSDHGRANSHTTSSSESTPRRAAFPESRIRPSEGQEGISALPCTHRMATVPAARMLLVVFP